MRLRPAPTHRRLIETTPRVLSFARLHLRIAVGALLDDPEGVAYGDVTALYCDYWHIANDLGLDLDKLIAEAGTEYEIRRLRSYL